MPDIKLHIIANLQLQQQRVYGVWVYEFCLFFLHDIFDISSHHFYARTVILLTTAIST